MTLTLQLASVLPRSKDDATLVYTIEVDLDWGDGSQPINHLAYELPLTGRVVKIMGGAILLKPGDNDAQMVVEVPPPPPIGSPASVRN